MGAATVAAPQFATRDCEERALSAGQRDGPREGAAARALGEDDVVGGNPHWPSATGTAHAL